MLSLGLGMARLGVDGRSFAGAAEGRLCLQGGVDRALAVLLALWAGLSLLPVGVWTRIADVAYYAETWGFWAATLALAALVTGLLLLVTRGYAARAARRMLAHLCGVRPCAFLLPVCLAATAEAAAVSLWCFARNPQAIDGWIQSFQARIFLSGRLVAPPPPSIAHFATLHMLVTDRGWFSQFPPVHPALLALGMAAGAGWLVTPLLTGLMPIAAYALGRHTGDERVARLAAVLVLLSPFVAGMGASAMNHIPAALCVALGLWSMPRVAEGRAWSAAVLGLAVGLCLGIRPLDATVLAAIGSLAVVAALRRGAWAVVPAAALAGAVAALPTVVYNAVTTGNPLRFTYFELWGRGLELGFHEVPWGDALTPARALGLTAVDAHQVNVYLLEWPLPVTALVAAALWPRPGRAGGGLRAPAAYLAVLVSALFFYFHRDTLYGPRFLFSAVPAMFVLVASGLVRLADLSRPLRWRGVTLGDAAVVGVLVVGLLAATLLAPNRVASFSTIGTSVALHPDEDAARAGIHHAVVVVPEGWGPRLIARMWDAGIPMRDSSLLYRAFNACDLQIRLATAERQGVRGAALMARLAGDARGADRGIAAPDIVPDRMIRLPSDHRLTPECVAEIERDRQGTMQFPAYLRLNAPALDGDIVWARDLGEANALLERVWPNRAVYRYRLSPESGRTSFTRLSP